MIGYTEYDTENQNTLLQATYLYNTKQQLDTAEVAFSYTAGGTAQSDMVYSYYEYRPYVDTVSADGGDMLSKMHLDGAGSDTEVEITYAYDALYRMTEKVKEWNNSLTMREAYTFADKTSKATTRVGSFTSTVGATSSKFIYSYDSFGNIKTISIPISEDEQETIIRYYYDDQQQLVRENNKLLGKTYVYTYDRGGNRTSKTTYTYTTGSLSGLTGTTTNYTYDGDRLTAIGSNVITYDDLGNPLTYGTAAYTWQNGRQLASISMNYGAMVYSFEYNNSGIRTSKTVNGIEHVYTLNGSQIVTESWVQNNVEHVIVYLYDESGMPIGMQYRTSNYAWGEFDNFYFEKNLFGDIVAVYNESGTKIGSYKYDAWGVCTASVESTASTFEKKVVRTLNPFRYRGYYFDTETGFYYLQSRYYNPQWGRFLNADGYINANGDLIGYNMYAYCSNNPVMYTDPTGEMSKLAIALLVVGGILAVAATAYTGYCIYEDVRDFDWSNQSEQDVMDAHFVSAYNETLVIKLPIGTNACSFGIMFIGNNVEKRSDATETIQHEYGHAVQFKDMGLFKYVSDVAIPSVTANILDQMNKLPYDYYGSPWEAGADNEGGVTTRNSNNTPWPTNAYNSYWDLIKLFF